MLRIRSQTVAVSIALAPAMLCALLLGACVLAQDLGSTGDATTPSTDTPSDAGADAEPRPGDGRDASAATDAGVDARPPADGPTGPGPLGALPSGYCCSSDDECRFRNCVETGNGGGKMCLDACSASRPFICKRPDLDFTCASLGTSQFCQPLGSFACLDAAQFVRGTKGTGSCCTAVDDGTMGRECEAHLCLALGTDPWFCTRRCDGDNDCPSDYRCVPVADRKECVPRSTPYVCK